MTAKDIEIDAGDVVLAGTLTVPDTQGPHPVVLTIHGTGPLDRDQNIKGQSLDIFNTIAGHLAARGIACLRYDKRGCARSGGDYYSAGQSELIADAAACANWLIESGRFSKLFLLGHSEGTLISPQVAQKVPGIAGLILLSPFIDNIEDIMRDQARKMHSAICALPGFKGLLARLALRLTGGPQKTVGKVIARTKTGNEDSFRIWFQRWPAKSGRQLMAADPRAIHESIDVPTLLVAGSKDLQCNPADAAHIAAIIGPDATAVTVPDLTHILRKDPGEHNFLSYPKLIQQPMDDDVLTIVGDWLAARIAA